ncbi:cation transporter, partial [Methylobacterium radiotolerans]
DPDSQYVNLAVEVFSMLADATRVRIIQECVAEHFDVPVEHSTFQLENAAHRDQEHLHH